MTPPEQRAELRRLAAAESVVDRIAPYLRDLTLVARDELPESLAAVRPPEWQIVHHERALQVSRIAVCGPRPDGGWAGCETLSVFRFTGAAPIAALYEHHDCTLRDLAADSITSYPLAAPKVDDTGAVRSSGYVSVAGRRAWAQYSTYIRGERGPFDGLLIYQTLLVDSESRTRLRHDITELGDDIHAAFLADIATVEDVSRQDTTAWEVMHDGA